MSDDIVDQLRIRHLQQACSDGESVYSQGADEIERLRDELAQMNAHADAWTDTANLYATNAEWWRAKAERAEVDADRLAAEVMRLMCACTWRTPGVDDYRCTKCVALDLHDKEVEAR